MSFWNSPLLQNLEDGELPTLDVNANVTIDQDSLIKLALAMVFAVVIILIVRTFLTQA